MRCPKCGNEMNHHADKVADPIDPRDTAAVDPELGGVLYEAHGCPGCGNVELRTTERSEATSNFQV
jgi:hypothetical protein